MTKLPLCIEIVCSERPGLSSMGRKSRAEIKAVLSARYEHVDVTIINNLHDLDMLVLRRPDLVFLGMKFIPSQHALGLKDPHKIWLSEVLDAAGIAYTGSDYRAIELELNKEHAKQCLLSAGLATAKYMVVRVGDSLARDNVTLSYPRFVKPTNRGGGTGIDAGSIVYSFGELLAKVKVLGTKLQADALVEEYLPGREFTISLLRQYATDTYTIMPLELIAPADTSGARFLSSQIKTADTERYLKVADGPLKEAINALAIKAFHELGAQDYGRIDIRLDAAGTPHFLEANLLPCLLSDYGNFPKACQLHENLSHESMVTRIVDLALYRNAAVYSRPDADTDVRTAVACHSFVPIS